MLSGPGQFAENETNAVNFREIPSHVLQKVCMYFTYKVRYTNSSTEIPEFPIQPEIAPRTAYGSKFLGLLESLIRKFLMKNNSILPSTKKNDKPQTPTSFLNDSRFPFLSFNQDV